jgi:dipeptidyl-peptidase-4
MLPPLRCFVIHRCPGLTRWLAWWAGWLAGPLTLGWAEGSLEDYRRAYHLAESYRDLMLGETLDGNWLDGSRFQYRTKIRPDTWQEMLVDARQGTRQVLVDDRRPRQQHRLAPLRYLIPSRSGLQPQEILFENRLPKPVQLWWVDTVGRRKLYHQLAARGSIKQSTWVGHSWLVTDLQQRPLRAFSVTAQGRRALITAQGPVVQLPETLPPPKEPSSSLISPDGRYRVERRVFAVEDRQLTLVESSPSDQLQPKVKMQAYRKPGDPIERFELWVIDNMNQERWLVPESYYPEAYTLGEIRWAKDSTYFTFLYNRRGHQQLQLWSVAPAQRQLQLIIDECSATFIDYAHKAFHRYLDDSQEVVWASERDGWCHLYLYDLKAGGLKRRLTSGNWVVRSIEDIDLDSRRLWFSAGGLVAGQDPYFRHLCQCSLDGSPVVQLTAGHGDHQWRLSPDRNYLVDSYSRVDLPPVHELRSAVTGQYLMTLERADDRLLRAAGWSPPQPFVAKGRDGITDIHGLIFRPRQLLPGRKYPIIEAIYAGPQSAFTPKRFGLHLEYQQLAELGFIVVKLDGMGTSHRSKAFHDVCWKNIADAGLPDRRLWIEAAARQHPEMDIQRVGIYGGSAGGQNALGALLFHGDFYDCAVADCGCHDNRLDKIWWNELWMGWPLGEHYVEQSNVTHAHRLQGKLLLIVGELDSNVDPASTLRVVQALIQANKDFEFLLVPGGGHGVGSQPYGQRRTWDFFVRHLQGGTPPRPEEYQ